MNNKKKLGIPIIGIALVIIAVLMAYGFYQNSDAVRINRQLELAQNYLLEGNYEQAIVAYKDVIQIDPKNVDAYLGLAEAYIGKGDLEEAVRILEEGYAVTGAEDLQVQIEVWSEELAQREAQKEAEEAEDLLAKENEAKDKEPESGTVEAEKESELSTELTESAKPESETQASEPESKKQTESTKKEPQSAETKQQPASAESEATSQPESIVTNHGTEGYQEIEYDSDGCYRVCSYDGQGRLIKSEGYYADGRLDGYGLYSYDEQGNQIKEEYYNADGTSSYGRSYDGQGNLTKEEYYNADGSLFEYGLYSYDGHGNRIKAERYDADGSLDYYAVWIYDEQDMLRQFEDLYFDGIRKVYYDEQGEEIKEERFNLEDGSLKWYTSSYYDERGNLIKEELYNADGSLDGYYLYRYDEQGQVIQNVDHYNADGVWTDNDTFILEPWYLK